MQKTFENNIGTFISSSKKARVFAFACYALYLILHSTFAHATTLTLDPASGSFGPGDMFVVTARIDTDQNECINAATVNLVFPKNLVKVTAVSKGESLMSLWADEPLINNDNGEVSWSGGIPGGYCGRVLGDPGKTNILGKVVFTILSTSEVSQLGEAEIPLRYGSSTQVLLNDGFGTIAPLTTKGATFTRVLRSSGVKNEWLDIVRADTLPPDPFTASIQRDDSTYAGKYFIVFSSIDKQSGVSHFEVMEDDPLRLGFEREGNVRAEFKSATSPYLLRDQSLRSRIVVRAIDNAGNIQETIIPPSNGALSIGGIRDASTSGLGAVLWFVLALVFIAVLVFMYFVYQKKQALEAVEIQHHEDTQDNHN